MSQMRDATRNLAIATKTRKSFATNFGNKLDLLHSGGDARLTTLLEIRATPYGHRVGTNKIRTYPPIATILGMSFRRQVLQIAIPDALGSTKGQVLLSSINDFQYFVEKLCNVDVKSCLTAGGFGRVRGKVLCDSGRFLYGSHQTRPSQDRTRPDQTRPHLTRPTTPGQARTRPDQAKPHQTQHGKVRHQSAFRYARTHTQSSRAHVSCFHQVAPSFSFFGSMSRWCAGVLTASASVGRGPVRWKALASSASPSCR